MFIERTEYSISNNRVEHNLVYQTIIKTIIKTPLRDGGDLTFSGNLRVRY
jgi:hypothetical protein